MFNGEDLDILEETIQEHAFREERKLLVDEIKILETDNQFLKQKYDEHEASLKILLEQLAVLEENLKTSVQEHAETKVEVEAMNRELEAKDVEIKALETELNGNRQELDENEDEIEQLEDKIKQQADQIQIQQTELRSLKQTKELQAQKITEYQEKIRKLTPSSEDCVKFLKLIQDEGDAKMFFISSNSDDARNPKYLKKFVFPLKMDMKKIIFAVFGSFHQEKTRLDELVSFIRAHHPILEDPPAPKTTTRTRKNSVKKSDQPPAPKAE
jgi:small-conductance mechanosensitive channel